MDYFYREIAGKMGDSEIYEDELIQFIELGAAYGKGMPYAKYSEYNESISTEISDKLSDFV